MKDTTLMEKLDTIDKFTGEDFTPDQYVNDVLFGKSFAYTNKAQRLLDIKEIEKSTEKLYNDTSEKFIDILLDNYGTFINIGKYVERIDKNISQAMKTQRTYSNLIQNLRKDVEEFSFSYNMYLRETQTTDAIIKDNIDNNVYMFEEVEEKESIDGNFDIDSFLNPKVGEKKWIEEASEKLKVLIDGKKFDDCISLVKEIRKCDLGKIEYQTKVEIDNTYNYLIEKITLAIGKCSSTKEAKFYLDKMKALGCSELAVDTFLMWLSKRLRHKIQKDISKEEEAIHNSDNTKGHGELNVIKEEDEDEEKESTAHIEQKYHIDQKIIKIISEYYISLGKYLTIAYEYFNLDSNVAYSTYIIPWLKQEIAGMNNQLEGLYAKVKSIEELKSIMSSLTKIFSQLNEKGQSGKFIYDVYYINNLKITLESIISFCMKNDPDGVPFDLKQYEINHNGKKLIFHSVSELGNGLYNIWLIISEFINQFLKIKDQFIGIVFLEEFLFDNILIKDFLDYIKSKIAKNMSNNYDVKPFGDSNESMASSNQILINYGITILSIEKIISFFHKEIDNNPLVNNSTKESILYLKEQINEEKNIYFSNLLKIKNEAYFYRFFDTQKSLLANDLTEKFKEPDRVFLVFFHLIKNLSKIIQSRIIKDEEASVVSYVKYFVLDSQYMNFLKIIQNLKILNEVYDTDFNLSQLGTLGFDVLLYGVLFVYYSIKVILKYDDDGSYKKITDEYLDSFTAEWAKLKQISSDKYKKLKNEYHKIIAKYVNDNKTNLLKGY